ncbi:MAG TPA: hypothetical protein VF792_02435 [Ktedonobacterales bacterium]
MLVNVIVLIVAAVLALPGGLFVAALISQPSARKYAMLGGVIGLLLTTAGLEYFVNAANVTIDAVSWFIGAFLACSMGVAVGALVVDFLTDPGRDTDVPISEP